MPIWASALMSASVAVIITTCMEMRHTKWKGNMIVRFEDLKKNFPLQVLDSITIERVEWFDAIRFFQDEIFNQISQTNSFNWKTKRRIEKDISLFEENVKKFFTLLEKKDLKKVSAFSKNFFLVLFRAIDFDSDYKPFIESKLSATNFSDTAPMP